ncbi:Peptidoglycan L-alanyl-D-glutamate endopeptidase CwlK precursor [compost metagenome]
MTMTLEQVLDKSKDVIAKLQPGVREAAIALVKRCYWRGVNIRITHGLRTYAEQMALFNQGRITPGNIVTNAKAGYSFHNFGVAIDFVLMASGYDMTADADKDGIADWTEVVIEATRLGFEWGGSWVSFKDFPHFQMTFGLTTAQYRSGRRPTQAQVNSVLSKIKNTEPKHTTDNKVEEDDSPMTPAEKVAFDQLSSTVAVQAQIIEKLESLAKMKEIPSWAVAAVTKAEKNGYINTPEGRSYDFYSTIVTLERTKIFDKPRGA